MITRNFKLFLNAGKQIPLMINVSQYDHGEKWVFTLYDDHGQKYEPSTGAIVGIKADNKGIINTGTVNSAGQVEIMETQQMTAAAGKAVFELLIDGDTHGTANFIVLVEPKPGDQADMSTSDLSLLQQAINSIAIAGSGAPAVATLAADMTDEGKIYLYAGSEVGYTAGDWYYYNGASWVDGGTYGGVVDATLTQPGQAADAKKTGDEINDLKSEIIAMGSGSVKQEIADALLACFRTVLGKDGFDDAYNALYTALNTHEVISITATFDQGEADIFTCYSLDDLKQYLTVTALFDDGTTGTVTGYTLSGDLEEGTSTITVTYHEKTDTFTVTDVIEGTDVTPAYSSFIAEQNTNVILVDDGVHITTKSKGTYRYGRVPIALKKDYTYRIAFDQTYVSGNVRVQFRDHGQGGATGTGLGGFAETNTTYHAERDFIPSENANWSDSTSPSQTSLDFYVTWSTSANGDATFTNLKIIEYLAEGE